MTTIGNYYIIKLLKNIEKEAKMQYDVAIIGGGVVGCAILDRLTLAGYQCILFESGGDVAVGASKANSGLVHAGFDCQPDTLKAKLNVRGQKLMEETCKRLQVPFKRCGAIVVGDDINKVRELYKRGVKNGVGNIRVVHRTALRAIVPNIAKNWTCGLYAPMAGMVSPYMLTIAMAEEAVLNGAKVLLNSKVTSIFKDKKDFLIHCVSGDERARIVINASGAGYNEVAKMLGAETYKMDFVRGEYYVLDRNEGHLTDVTVFPMPSDKGKGILITPTIDGNILVGPNAEHSNVMTLTTPSGLKEVKEGAKSLIPSIDFSKSIRNYAGVRVKVANDFVIEKSKEVANVINIAGICSPGLTSALAIAEMVETLISKDGTATDLKKVVESKLVGKREYVPRAAYNVTANMSQRALNELIKENNRYGKIVCRCEHVTEGEIVQALRSPLRPNTVDGIKRRTRAGMGRCQGGFCLNKVIEIIARENKVVLSRVNKENIGSNLIVSDIKPARRGE